MFFLYWLPKNMYKGISQAKAWREYELVSREDVRGHLTHKA